MGKPLFSSRGATLVELMVTLGISTLLLVMVLQVINETFNLQMRESALSAVASELGILNGKIAKADQCTAALSDVPFNPSLPAQDIPATAVDALNLTFTQTDQVRLQRAQIHSTGLLQIIPLNATTTYELHKATLNFDFQTAADSIGGKDLKTRQIVLQVIVNRATNKIVSCQGDFGNVGDHCSLIGGTYDPTRFPNCQMPVFKVDCGANTVVKGTVSAGFLCGAPASPPTGPASGATAQAPAKRYMITQTFSCAPGNCSCPNSFPFLVTGGAPGPSLVCAGYSMTPPARTLAEVTACLTQAHTADPSGVNAVKLGGIVIRHGFGPAFSCP